MARVLCVRARGVCLLHGIQVWLSSLSFLLGACASEDPQDRGAPEPEISWEMSHGSPDFMQKIRLNSGLKRVNSCNPLAAACAFA
ncbi:hypothetical protein MLD38_034471 [Melastoma candidum]|uniref:Uncharacterized protein n=1 Tax=Melastoma candidum TaxID=119954 RepID=A0ACB9MAN0_9MYRT|nr:hypothetical protein MLD38_034471 [Melastoma candidum]